MFEALELMQYDAFVPGPAELTHFDVLGAVDGIPITAVNIVGTRRTWPYSEPLHLSVRGAKVLFVGIMSRSSVNTDGEWRATNEIEAIATAVNRFSRDRDLLVIGVHGDGDDAMRIAEAFPEANLVVGRTSGEGHWSNAAGRAPVLSVGGSGQYVGNASIGGDAATGRLIWLDSSVPEDPILGAFVDDLEKRLESLDPTALQDAVHTIETRGFLGSSACGSCHVSAFRGWTEHSHARAMSTLREVGSHHRRKCIGCHLVDHGEPDPIRRGVGCEACHGAGHELVLLREQTMSRACTSTSTTRARRVCASCHDPEHSIEFSSEYFHKVACGVAHGR